MTAEIFLNHVKRHGLARSNRFRVNIALGERLVRKISRSTDSEPSLLNRLVKAGSVILGGSSQAARSLSLMCEVTSLPGLNVLTQEIKNAGPMRKMPYGSLHDDLQFTFMVSRDMLEKRIFDMWSDLVVDRHTKNIGYYKDYVSEIQIDQLDEQDEVTYSIVLEEAYPIIVTDMERSAGAADEVSRLNVMFAYKKWRPTNQESETSQNARSNLSNFSPFRFVEALQEGDVAEAITSAIKIKNSIDTGNFTGEALAVFNMVDDVLQNNVGISASDVERVIRNISKDVKLNPRLSDNDKDNLNAAIDQVLDRL